MLKDYVQKVAQGQDLTVAEMTSAMDIITEGKGTDALVAALLTGLAIKGECPGELLGGAQVLRRKALPLDLGNIQAVDTCGTGGDGFHTINISTASMFVAAGAGVPVVKHGNRSVSSQCGSADVLEELGIHIDLEPTAVRTTLRELGLGFLFAPTYHQAMKYVMPVRRQLAMRTIFNLLGPLSNPAGVQGQVLGVYDAKLLRPFTQVLRALGVNHALVVNGRNGMDELSLSGETTVCQLKDDKVHTFVVRPEDLGLKSAPVSTLRGGDKVENATHILELLSGKQGPMRDFLLLNSAAAIYVGGKAKDLQEGVTLARLSIDSGSALQKLQAFAQRTKELSHDPRPNCTK